MRKAITAAIALGWCILGAPASAGAGERFVLSASRDAVDGICQTYGLQRIRGLGRPDLYVVMGPDRVSTAELEATVAADPLVLGFEHDDLAVAPESRATSSLSQSTAAILDALDRSPTEFFGGLAWAGYVQQPAGTLIGVDRVHQDEETGASVVVAVIDTGVDPNQPLLKDSLIPGFDFTRNFPGTASEWADLTQSTAAILDQSTAAILDQASTPVVLNQSTAAILDQSTAAILDGTTPLPAAFGHGTMVAGLIHLVAPQARIMPLKAFRADGSSQISDIIRAIYFAVDNGAKVINMSFSTQKPSGHVRGAIQYATNQGVVCVGSAGNDNKETLVYPAALKRVIGVASTTLQDTRAPFSNYGDHLVEVAAPGENLITTYPGGHYAAVSGTSFSSALVSGAAAILAGVKPDLDHKTADEAFQHSLFISEDLGFGRIDIQEAVRGLERLR